MTAHPTDLLPGYVLGDLAAQEAETVEVHLLGCPSCRAEVARLWDALFSLADDLPAAAPSAGTWDRIQARRQPLRVQPPHRSVWPWWSAAAVVALLALGGSVTWSQFHPARQASVERWEAPGVTRLVLISREGTPFGSLLVRPDGQALVMLNRPAPNGQVYQAWGRQAQGPRAGVPVSLGITDGRVMQVVWTGFDSVGISVEPMGGSPAPTHPLGRVVLPRV
ncbi:MAG: anti-sigma factor [Deinococcota bacterium]